MAVRAERVPAAKCGESEEVEASEGKLRCSVYFDIRCSQNLARRARASSSPGGQRDLKRFFSSAVKLLFGGAVGNFKSKSLAKFFRAEEGFLAGGGNKSRRSGFA